jgi:hypothetical protein
MESLRGVLSIYRCLRGGDWGSAACLKQLVKFRDFSDSQQQLFSNSLTLNKSRVDCVNATIFFELALKK